MESDIKAKGVNETHLAEIAYHRKQNYLVVFSGLPGMTAYAGFYLYISNYFQATLFILMVINALAGLIIGYRLKDLRQLTLLKRISAGIWATLFATSVLAALWDPTIYYIAMPWLFLFPLVAVMFFGRRIGFITATVFCALALSFFLINDMPPLTKWNIFLFRLNAVWTLLAILAISVIYEKSRMSVQDDLAKSENQYKLAEQLQRETNVELEQEIERRKHTERALAESEKHYRALFEESVVPLWEEDWSLVKSHLDQLPQDVRDHLSDYFKQDPGRIEALVPFMRVKAVNRATLKLYGAESQQMLLRNLSRIISSESLDFVRRQVVSLYQTARFDAEVNGLSLDGRKLHLLVSSTIPAGYENSWENVFSSVYDITERIKMEQEKKRVEQKMQNARQIQAIATLAGGIAHQFNNALAVIYGSLDLLEMNAPANTDSHKFLKSLKTSAARMGRLTDQLLAYAEGGKYQPQPFSVNEVVSEIINSKTVLRDSTIEILTELSSDDLISTGDITQIKMVVDVILSNSFEALQQGGRVIISTGRRQLKADGELADQAVKPGEYTYISIEDNGIGMTEETLKRIFEPFFTTKIYGRGLGMAAAFGIIRNHDGLLTVDSEPGRGTRVVIYLPGSDQREHRAQQLSLQ